MSDCCQVSPGPKPGSCLECGRRGFSVDQITLRALLRPEALARLAEESHRFCPNRDCPIVYFGLRGAFRRGDVLVPVFQKEAVGRRTVCYCFDVREDQLRQEIEATRSSPSTERIKALVQAGRCACELRNPQGTCCLGNVGAVVKAATSLYVGSGRLD